jgi:hypothetical protein
VFVAIANLRVEDKEVSVEYEERTSGSLGDCHYCGRPGAEAEAVEVEQVTLDGVVLSSRTKLYRAAAAKFKELMFHGRRFHTSSNCTDRIIRDQHSHPDLTL